MHTFYHVDPEKHEARMRVQKLLGWLAKPEWNGLSDRDFVRALFREYEAFAGRPLLDPAE
jgi:hypothetical protein